MHRRSAEYDQHAGNYDEDTSKNRRGGWFSTLAARITGLIRIPRHWVNFVLTVINERPSAILVTILMATAIVYLGIYFVMPSHAHDRYEHASRHGPLYCVGVILACLAWLARDSRTPFHVIDYTCRIGKPAYYDDNFEDNQWTEAHEDQLNKAL